jgi:hypothetical protein
MGSRGYDAAAMSQFNVVMAGLVPAIHALLAYEM